MPGNRPFVLAIAGHDPSGGAGITADIKTFEAHETYGLGVCSAITFQNDIAMTASHWLSKDDIFGQLESLIERFSFEFVKVGIIQDLILLNDIIDFIQNHNAAAKFILDPVIKASTGFTFHTSKDLNCWEDLFKRLFLITPNWDEIQWLYPNTSPQEALKLIGKHCHVLLKGGHRTDQKGLDLLSINEEITELPAKAEINASKHGSGCVFAAAITANLALGLPLQDACKKAKRYTAKFLTSNKSLLGYHYA